jgi:hypothetical protein
MIVGGTIVVPATDSVRASVSFSLLAEFADARFDLLGPHGTTSRTALRRDTVGDNVRWTLRPGTPFPARRPIVIRVQYRGAVRTHYVFHVGPDASFGGGKGVAWYPRVRGLPDARGVGDVTFLVPAGLTAVSSGRRVSTRAEERRGRFRFRVDAPLAFSFAVGRYHVMQRPGPVPIRIYALADRRSAPQYAAGVARILPVLVREFGAYPYPEFAVVETPAEASQAAGLGGASMEGFMFASSPSLDRPFNLAFYAHEISHQWWANLVSGADSAIMMLSEGMAQYGSLRAVELLEGPAAAARYRRTGYPNYGGQSAQAYFELAVAGLDRRPLLRLGGDRIDHDLTDTKGFIVWDMLSRALGRERFRAGLRAVTRLYAFQSVTWPAFRREFERAAHADITRFVNDWMERTGAPEWSLEWRQRGDTLAGRIAAASLVYHARLPLTIRGSSANEAMTLEVPIDDSVAVFRASVPFAVRDVTLDPDFEVLHWEPGLAAEAQAIAPYTRALYAAANGPRASAYATYESALAQTNDSTRTLRSLLEYGLAWLHYGDRRYEDAIRWMNASMSDAHEADAPSCRAPGGSCTIPWGQYLIARAALATGDTSRACVAAERAVRQDSTSDYGVRGGLSDLLPRCARVTTRSPLLR